MMTNSSADASGPVSVRATPGASAMMRVLSRRKPLTISVSAPLRRTIAASGEPEAVMAFSKPTPMESTPTRTATTPAMPMTAAATDPRRCGMLSKPNLLTEATCESPVMGALMFRSHSPEGIGHSETHGLEGGEDAGEHPERNAQPDADEHIHGREVEHRQHATGGVAAGDEQPGQPQTQPASQHRQHAGFGQHERKHLGAGEPHCFECAQLARPLTHRQAHGVAGDQQDREEHGAQDAGGD